MKNWSGQIFPITLLALVAALSYWLQASLNAEAPGSKVRKDDAPDAFAEKFEIRRHDEEGLLKYRLSAPHLQHFPHDDSSEIRQPELIAYRKDAPPITMTAGLARVLDQGETIVLSDSVRVVRAEQAKRPELVAETSQLNVKPNAGLAETDQELLITYGSSRISGIGARIDNNASTFVLKSQVRGQYLAPRAKP